MTSLLQSRFAHLFFQVSTAIKGIDGVLESIGGLTLLLVSKPMLNKTVLFLTQHELTEDPHDRVANFFVSLTQHLSTGTKTYAALYLLIHGIVKIFLVVNLLREKLWIFPVSIAVLFAFVVYQTYRLTVQFTWPMLLLTLFDALIILSVWNEYRLVRARMATS